MSKINIIKNYFKAIENKNLEDLLKCYDPNATQIELPNLLKSKGDKRTISDLKRDFAKGAKILRTESYEILSAVEENDRLAVEVLWCGTLAIPVKSLREGDQMKAHSAIFFDFKNDLIIKQKNYDCFEAF